MRLTPERLSGAAEGAEMSLFDGDVEARCARCGKWVQTLDGWPIPVAACVSCDVWTIYQADRVPQVIEP